MSQGFNPQGSQGFNPHGGQGFNPQGQGSPNPPRQAVQSPLLWSILSAVCCCSPLGIVSIVYAVKVNKLLAAGAYKDAKEAAGKAKMWAWIALGVGAVLEVLSTVVYILLMMASAADSAGGYGGY